MLPNTLIATGLAMVTAAVAAPIIPLNACSFTYMDPPGISESAWPSHQNAEKRSTAIRGSRKQLDSLMCPEYPIPAWVVPKPIPTPEEHRQLMQVNGKPATQAIPKRSKVFASSDKKNSDKDLTSEEHQELRQLSSGFEGNTKPDQADEDLGLDNEAIPKRSTAFACSNDKNSNLLPCPDPPINNWGLPPNLNHQSDVARELSILERHLEEPLPLDPTTLEEIEASRPAEGNPDIQHFPAETPQNEKRWCIMKDCSKQHLAENYWLFGSPEPSFIGMAHDPAYDTPNLMMASPPKHRKID